MKNVKIKKLTNGAKKLCFESEPHNLMTYTKLTQIALLGLALPFGAHGIVTFTTVPEQFTFIYGSAAQLSFAKDGYPENNYVEDAEYAVRFTPTVTGELTSIETTFGYFANDVTDPDNLAVTLRLAPAVATISHPDAARIPQIDQVMTSWTIESEQIFRNEAPQGNVTEPVLALTANPGIVLQAGLDYWLWIAPGNSISQSVYWPLNPDDSEILTLPAYTKFGNGVIQDNGGQGAAPAFRVNVSPVPEPAFYAALLAAVALVFTFLRRRA